MVSVLFLNSIIVRFRDVLTSIGSGSDLEIISELHLPHVHRTSIAESAKLHCYDRLPTQASPSRDIWWDSTLPFRPQSRLSCRRAFLFNMEQVTYTLSAYSVLP